MAVSRVYVCIGHDALAENSNFDAGKSPCFNLNLILHFCAVVSDVSPYLDGCRTYSWAETSESLHVGPPQYNTTSSYTKFKSVSSETCRGVMK